MNSKMGDSTNINGGAFKESVLRENLVLHGHGFI